MNRALPLFAGPALVSFAAAIMRGERTLPATEVRAALTGTGDGPTRTIPKTLRLPRALTAVTVGAAANVARTTGLAILRPPLADPGIIGIDINAGAALAAMLVIVEIDGLLESRLPLASFAEALAVSILVFAFAWRGGTPPRLILVGIGLLAFEEAGASVIATDGDVAPVQRAMVWLARSLQVSRWDALPGLLAWTVRPVTLVWLPARELDLIAMGDAVACRRGPRADARRAAMILAVATICGAAGPIAFVDLAFESTSSVGVVEEEVP